MKDYNFFSYFLDDKEIHCKISYIKEKENVLKNRDNDIY